MVSFYIGSSPLCCWIISSRTVCLVVDLCLIMIFFIQRSMHSPIFEKESVKYYAAWQDNSHRWILQNGLDMPFILQSYVSSRKYSLFALKIIDLVSLRKIVCSHFLHWNILAKALLSSLNPTSLKTTTTTTRHFPIFPS